MKREPGFYWVKYAGEWLVCEWDGYFWTLPGQLNYDRDLYFWTLPRQLNYDTDLDAIHETRLMPPENADSRPE